MPITRRICPLFRHNGTVPDKVNLLPLRDGFLRTLDRFAPTTDSLGQALAKYLFSSSRYLIDYLLLLLTVLQVLYLCKGRLSRSFSLLLKGKKNRHPTRMPVFHHHLIRRVRFHRGIASPCRGSTCADAYLPSVRGGKQPPDSGHFGQQRPFLRTLPIPDHFPLLP